jgi:hypothetical protein
MAHKPNFTAQLTNKEAVRNVAASIGCIHTRGREKGQGSIREMLEEIGGGEVLVMHHVYDDGKAIRKDVKELRKLAKQYSNANLENTLLALANALESIQDIETYND